MKPAKRAAIYVLNPVACSKPKDHHRVLAINADALKVVLWSGVFWGAVGGAIYLVLR